MIYDSSDIIAAPASGSGGAISVIRISGAGSVAMVSSLFIPGPENNDSERSLITARGFTLHYGYLKDRDAVIDEVIVSVFRQPHSYTGEDSVEISCHASPYIEHKIMEMLTGKGARAAMPGEFTRRAFINGRIDLSQAEAVADLIASESEASHRLAMNQMRGGFSQEINSLRDKLLQFASLIELELDFGDEDVDFADRDDLKATIGQVREVTETLAASFRLGNAIRNGFPVAIAGRSNSGKSTILNGLLRDDRAIVSDIPGTTRDAIEANLNIGGILFRFIDTAGLRETSDIIENLGIRKTYQKINEAMVVLLVTDATDGADIINATVEIILKQMGSAAKELVLIINKCDLLESGQCMELHKSVNLPTGVRSLMINAREEDEIARLRDLLLEITGSGDAGNTLIITNS
ncbi:MAG: tRNA uridine-5-carboxymethylaminomethyl(34) synthesis GTPase MnmE, partial [Bacteroidales bacterium]